MSGSWPVKDFPGIKPDDDASLWHMRHRGYGLDAGPRDFLIDGLSGVERMMKTPWLSGLSAALVLALSGCGAPQADSVPRGGRHDASSAQRQLPSLFGERGLNLGGLPTDDQGGGSGSGIAVNSFLWRASLDTIAFMPLASADPFGGVIITDWYSPPESPEERFKVNVYILDRQLRADGIRAAVFRQRLAAGQWAEAPVDKATATELENAILTRARQLRVSQAS